MSDALQINSIHDSQLVKRITTVSVETIRIVKSLPVLEVR